MNVEDTFIASQEKNSEKGAASYLRLRAFTLPSDVEDYVHRHGGLLADS